MTRKRKIQVSDEQIIATYQAMQSCGKAARSLGIGNSTIERVLTKHRVERTGRAHYLESAVRFRGEEKAIREFYEAGATYKDICERFGQASAHAIRSAIKRAGGQLREDDAPREKQGEIDRIRELHASGLGQMRISLELGRSQPFVSRLMRKNGMKPLTQSGAKHSQWKGGRTIDTNGYVRAWVAADDPLREMSLSDGYVLEHRLVMARSLGRSLRRSETVHHINGDRTDNRLENLQLRQGKHGKNSAYQCADCGSHNIIPVAIRDHSKELST